MTIVGILFYLLIYGVLNSNVARLDKYMKSSKVENGIGIAGGQPSEKVCGYCSEMTCLCQKCRICEEIIFDCGCSECEGCGCSFDESNDCDCERCGDCHEKLNDCNCNYCTECHDRTPCECSDPE